MPTPAAEFLSALHPYNSLDPDTRDRVAAKFERRDVTRDTQIYTFGEVLDGLFVIEKGTVRVTDQRDRELSRLGAGNTFGERGLLIDGTAATNAAALEDTTLHVLPAAEFKALLDSEPVFARFFQRGALRPKPERKSDLATTPVAQLMTRSPLTCRTDLTAGEAARRMAEANVSSLCVVEGDSLVGIVTIRDLSGRILGDGRPAETPIREVMTPDPHTLPSNAIGTDVLHAMMELKIGHIPIVDGGRLVGIVTQTNLTRQQAITSAWLVSDIATASDAVEIASATKSIPELLANLVGAGSRHDVVTRLITDIADAATRRLLALAEAELGPAPVPYLWLACGSQGRREQTGVSDQDNCLILDDSATEVHDAYFSALADHVSDGLNQAGYVFCPGDMMATNPRWRQPFRVWQKYFEGWIRTPNPEAQMLASVMFDLRPIGGDQTLFSGLRAKTLTMASENSIFVAHMVANSLKHQPPLGLLRGIATIRSGEHRNTVDLKMSGVVPIVDLARLYALMGQLEPVNTRARLELAAESGGISQRGARDLLDAYDLIAEIRLRHQARRVSEGLAPNNYVLLGDLSDLERSHLRDAFVVVRTMQSAVAQGRGTVL